MTFVTLVIERTCSWFEYRAELVIEVPITPHRGMVVSIGNMRLHVEEVELDFETDDASGCEVLVHLAGVWFIPPNQEKLLEQMQMLESLGFTLHDVEVYQ